jgi:hypothetical protein
MRVRASKGCVAVVAELAIETTGIFFNFAWIAEPRNGAPVEG